MPITATLRPGTRLAALIPSGNVPLVTIKPYIDRESDHSYYRVRFTHAPAPLVEAIANHLLEEGQFEGTLPEAMQFITAPTGLLLSHEYFSRITSSRHPIQA